MTSKKILSAKAANQLLNSLLLRDSGNQLCAPKLQIRAFMPPKGKQFSTKALQKTSSLNQATRLTTVSVNSVRLSSSLNTSATSTSLKREASTQAQQQVADHQIAESNKYCESFRSSELEIVKCSPDELRPKPNFNELIFGHVYTDHMFRVDWDYENGWSTPLISKVHNFDFHPGAKVFHYAVGAFEGAKVYRGFDNKIRFFRIDQNIKRLLNSAKRLSLPEFNVQELIKCIHKLVQIDQSWVPPTYDRKNLTSLYIRPTILGIEPSLGVARSKLSTLYVLMSPVGPYFKDGQKPVSLYADPDVVRSWPGGAGDTKLSSNYAPTIQVQVQAEQLGLQQVLWLYGDDEKLTEVGTMNIFVVYKHAETGKIHLATPPLTDGLVLPGITRSSILDLVRQWSDVVCEERYVTIGEIKQLIHERRLVEMFGSGTACIICPIGLIQMKDDTKLKVPFIDKTESTNTSPESNQSLSERILKAITDIQYGIVSHPWTKELGSL